MKPVCTILSPGIIVVVFGAEFCPILWKAGAELSINAVVDDPVLVRSGADDEVIHNNFGRVSIKIGHFDQKLLGLFTVETFFDIIKWTIFGLSKGPF